MIYNFHEEENKQNKWTYFTILEAVTLSNAIDQSGFDPTKIDITLTINGIEISLMQMIEWVANETDRIAKDKAISILDNKVFDLIKTIEQSQEMFNSIIQPANG